MIANKMIMIFDMIGDIFIDKMNSLAILMIADLNMTIERACDGSGNWIAF